MLLSHSTKREDDFVSLSPWLCPSSFESSAWLLCLASGQTALIINQWEHTCLQDTEASHNNQLSRKTTLISSVFFVCMFVCVCVFFNVYPFWISLHYRQDSTGDRQNCKYFWNKKLVTSAVQFKPRFSLPSCLIFSFWDRADAVAQDSGSFKHHHHHQQNIFIIMHMCPSSGTIYLDFCFCFR